MATIDIPGVGTVDLGDVGGINLQQHQRPDPVQTQVNDAYNQMVSLYGPAIAQYFMQQNQSQTNSAYQLALALAGMGSSSGGGGGGGGGYSPWSNTEKAQQNLDLLNRKMGLLGQQRDALTAGKGSRDYMANLQSLLNQRGAENQRRATLGNAAARGAVSTDGTKQVIGGWRNDMWGQNYKDVGDIQHQLKAAQDQLFFSGINAHNQYNMELGQNDLSRAGLQQDIATNEKIIADMGGA